ncbi:winged helix-turn-helix transcriptional regulator [Petrocella sp. FN5]|uniref:winged helix-turn-helix transcriptional regulator n=1 Tax=Petrocella sp. FN5 TaxID=3032002 RepID=UPI0023D9D50B|nr:winged helix-turn-helix transcriptional regulator [Petrocella sp. FN5]MDF1618463.1 winged helix-turn-helix transcriptional regulator [Petrocella sp. FN5]
MDKTLRIMLTIEEIPDISQRQLAKRTGYSLGTVNGLLQKLIDNNHIVSRAITPNHYIYEITSTGDLLKAHLLYDFIVDGYEVIGKVRTQAKKVIEESVRQGVFMFYLYGEEDALFKLIKMSLIEYKRRAAIDYETIESIDQVDASISHRVLVWNKETVESDRYVVNVLLNHSGRAN